MVTYSQIEKQFRETLGFIQQDINRLLTLEPGVNYAAAAVIASACEVVSRYRYSSGEGAMVFEKLLPTNEPYPTIAKTLYNALRNGLAHGYYGKDIRLNGERIALDIAWKETPHLKIVERDDGKPHLVLNVHELCARLSAEIGDFREQLKSEADVRDRFFKEWQAIETGGQPVGPDEVEEWRSMIEHESRH